MGQTIKRVFRVTSGRMKTTARILFYLNVIILIIGGSSQVEARVTCPRDKPHIGKRYCPDGSQCYQTGARWRCRPVAGAVPKDDEPPPEEADTSNLSDDESGPGDDTPGTTQNTATDPAASPKKNASEADAAHKDKEPAAASRTPLQPKEKPAADTANVIEEHDTKKDAPPAASLKKTPLSPLPKKKDTPSATAGGKPSEENGDKEKSANTKTVTTTPELSKGSETPKPATQSPSREQLKAKPPVEEDDDDAPASQTAEPPTTAKHEAPPALPAKREAKEAKPVEQPPIKETAIEPSPNAVKSTEPPSDNEEGPSAPVAAKPPEKPEEPKPKTALQEDKVSPPAIEQPEKMMPKNMPKGADAAESTSPNSTTIQLPWDKFAQLNILCRGHCEALPRCHFGGKNERSWYFSRAFVDAQERRGFTWATLCLAQVNAIHQSSLNLQENIWPPNWADLKGDKLKGKIIEDMTHLAPNDTVFKFGKHEYHASNKTDLAVLKTTLMHLSLERLLKEYLKTLGLRDSDLAFVVAKPFECHKRGIPLLDCQSKDAQKAPSGKVTIEDIKHILLAKMAAIRFGCTLEYDGSARSAKVNCPSNLSSSFLVKPGKYENYSLRADLANTGALPHSHLIVGHCNTNDYCKFESDLLKRHGIDPKEWNAKYRIGAAQVFVSRDLPKGFAYALNPNKTIEEMGEMSEAPASKLLSSKMTKAQIEKMLTQ